MKKTILCFLLLFTPVFFANSQAITVNVQIETHLGNILNENVEISACPDSQDGDTLSLNALCAIETVANAKNWPIEKTWYSFGASLDKLSDFSADFTNNRFWLYFVNQKPGEVALNSQILQPNDQLLLVYGTNPLKISVSPGPNANATTTFSVNYFDFNSWNWQTANNAIFVINGNKFPPESDGAIDFFVENNADYKIWAELGGYINSNVITFSTKPATPPAQNAGGIWLPPIPPKDFIIGDAVAFIAKTAEEGKLFGSEIYTDWVAIALGALDGKYNLITEKLGQHISSHPIKENSFLTDYERRAMALMALNINPQTEAGLNYIEKILESYDGKQFGDPLMINDDIFAIIPLIKNGLPPTDEKILSSGKFIAGFQNATTGSFGSPDMTAAAIQALKMLPEKEFSTNIVKAKNYLKISQMSDGGWGNSFSTSWALQAIYALGEQPEDWKRESGNPFNYIGSHQADDGGLDKFANPEARLWATAYAVPAALGKPWAEILKSFTMAEKPFAKSKKGETKTITAEKPRNSQNAAAILLSEEKIPTDSNQSSAGKKIWQFFLKLFR